MTLMAWMAASVVFLLQLAALATQQQPARGSIEGVVERSGTGEPIAGAEIRVMRVAMPVEEDRVGPRMAVVFTGSDPFAPVPAITDREGHFLLKDLEPGSYKMTAARNGYTKQEYGQRIPAGQGTVVTLASGQTLKGLAFYLIPGGTISGRVRDYGGEPITGARVELLRATYVRPGKRDFRIAGSALTDDRGEYIACIGSHRAVTTSRSIRSRDRATLPTQRQQSGDEREEQGRNSSTSANGPSIACSPMRG